MYCEAGDLKDYVLEAYLAKAEELNPGAGARHIATVAEEIDGALLQAGHSLPLERVPGKLRHIAAVIAAYRTVSNVTSLMSQDTGAGNDWVGLQTLHKQAVADLAAIRAGTLDLFPTNEPEPDVGIRVSSPPRLFGDDAWRRY